ncbi:MAG: response regulator [Immundisolibacterales bacterium]|nr:response regulator [Immundisolibacterales bacterium]
MQRTSKIGSIRVILVEDEILVRSLIKERLEATGNIEIVGEAINGEEAVRLVKKRSPEVVVLDTNLTGIGAIEATRLLRRVDDSVRLVALSPNVDPSVPLRLLEMGVDGYVTKSSMPEELEEAIREVHRGRKYLDPRVARNIVLDQVSGRMSPLDILTPREVEIMTWIAKGKKVAEIADALARSPKTISTLRSRVFRKLDVNSDVEVALLAIRHRLVNLDFLS